MARFFSSLRFRLLVLVLLAVIPALAVVVHGASEQRQFVTIQTEENALRVARAAASRLEQRVESARQYLIVLAQLPGVRDPDPAVCSAFLATLLEQYPQYGNLAVSDRAGNIFCSATPLTAPVNILDDGFVPHVIATRDFGAGEYRVLSSGENPIIGFGYPLFDRTGQVQAVVMASVHVASLNQLAAESLLPPGSTLTIRDRKGTIVARYPNPDAWVGKSIPESPLLEIIQRQQPEGTAEAVSVDGLPRLYAFTTVRGLPVNDLYISVGIPTTVAFAKVNQALLRNVIALGLIGVLALAAAWFGGDFFLLRHVRALLSVTERLADGDLSARSGVRYGVGELSQLARAFDRMVGSLEQRASERKSAEEQLRRQAARAESLVSVAGHLNAQLDLQTVLHAICEETARALNVPEASVRLYDKGRDIRYRVTSGLSTENVDYQESSPVSAYDQLPRQYKSTVAFSDMTHDSQPPGDAPDALPQPRTMVGAQMVREGQLIGVLNVFLPGAMGALSEDDLTLLRGLAAQAALAIVNARLYEALQREERARAGLLHQVISAQEDERLRIARELHDETSQSLSTLILGLETANLALADDHERATQQLRTTRFIAEGMLDDIHRLIEDLRPLHLDVLGLASAIQWYGEQRLNPLGISLKLNMDGLQDRLPTSMELALFRIVQEALTNVIRHAQATAVNVSLAQERDDLILRVADNGRGFDPSLQAQGKGFGLRGMEERVHILNGEFQIRTEPGTGTVVEARVPMSKEEVSDGQNPGAAG